MRTMTRKLRSVIVSQDPRDQRIRQLSLDNLTFSGIPKAGSTGKSTRQFQIFALLDPALESTTYGAPASHPELDRNAWSDWLSVG